MIDKVLNKAIDIQAAQLDKAKDIAVRAHSAYGPRAWIGLGVLLGAVTSALVAGFLLRDFGKRNIEYFPDMGYSEAWESQTTHDYAKKYADYTPELPPYIEKWGTAEMPPPDGTVYRGQKTLSIPADVPTGLNDRLAWAKVNLSNPYANVGGHDQELVLKRGKNLFRHSCQGCHGVDGVGMAPVTKFGIGAPALDTAVVRDKYSDGELFYVITFGINTMPAHKNHVKYDDRWKLIRYLRELQKGK